MSGERPSRKEPISIDEELRRLMEAEQIKFDRDSGEAVPSLDPLAAELHREIVAPGLRQRGESPEALEDLNKKLGKLKLMIGLGQWVQREFPEMDGRMTFDEIAAFLEDKLRETEAKIREIDPGSVGK